MLKETNVSINKTYIINRVIKIIFVFKTLTTEYPQERERERKFVSESMESLSTLMIHFKTSFVLEKKIQVLSSNKICKIYQIPIKISIKLAFNGVKKDLPQNTPKTKD